MNFRPVRTADDLDTLSHDEIVEGFIDGLRAEKDDPEPGLNRGRAYWHGWRVAMMDRGRIEIDADHRHLVHKVAPRGVVRK